MPRGDCIFPERKPELFLGPIFGEPMLVRPPFAGLNERLLLFGGVNVRFPF
jgi:hypothetical protein